MRFPHFAAIVTALTVTSTASAQDDTSKPPATTEESPKGWTPLMGANVGFVDASRRLGFSVDVALDLLVRKRFGAVGFVTGLRPHYERFGLGHSDDMTCSGATQEACGAGSPLFLSQTTAHAASLEVPFVAELYAAKKPVFIPYIGVSPWLVWLRATETTRGAAASTTAYENTASSTFLALGVFGGLSIPTSKSSSLVARVGFRFAPYDEIPGGRASVRGESVSIGYRVEL